MPWALATALPSSISPLTSARRSGRSQTRPCVRPVSAPSGFEAALKMTLRHCAGRPSATAWAGMPARVQASASRSTSAGDAGCGSNGANVVSPLTSHCTSPGSSSLPAGKVVPRMTRSTWAASTSSLPTPFMTEATAPPAKACAVAEIADSACIALVATMPKSQGGSAPGSLVACRCPWTSPAPHSRSPRSPIASTCGCERSKAHTSTSSSVARLAANSDPTAPQPTMQILMEACLPESTMTGARPAAILGGVRTRARR